MWCFFPPSRGSQQSEFCRWTVVIVGKLVLPCVSRAAILTAWTDCSAVITGLNVHSEVFCCWWIPSSFRGETLERHSEIKRDTLWFIALHSVWNNQQDAGCRRLALNRCFWEIYSKVVVPLHSWCFLHAEDELAVSLTSKLEKRKMGIIRVTLIHLLPFIDHGRAERGFITARSFSAQTHLVKEWADVWAAWWSAGSCPCCVFVS